MARDTATDPADPRARIVAALHRRGERATGDTQDASAPLHHPADGPPPRVGEELTAAPLPVLIDAIPGDASRAPQTQFTLELRIAFLETLAVIGSVRSAAKRVGVSHQTVYRARRASAAFGRAWDAAMVVARAQAEARLSDCAMEGYEEEVWYHGEHVGMRRRFSERMLLAHLGRLDRYRADERIDALAEDFDGMIDRMRAGGAIDAPPPAPEPAPETPPETAPETEAQADTFSSNGQCHTRSMSPDPDRPGEDARAARDARLQAKIQDPRWDPYEDEDADDAWQEAEANCPCVGKRNGTDGDQDHYHWQEGRWHEGLKPVENEHGEGPCCPMPEWPECRTCPHVPEWLREIGAMEDERPANVLHPDDLEDWDLCEQAHEAQAAAYAQGLDEWWSVTTQAELAELRERAGRVAEAGELVENR